MRGPHETVRPIGYGGCRLSAPLQACEATELPPSLPARSGMVRAPCRKIGSIKARRQLEQKRKMCYEKCVILRRRIS